MHKGDHVSRVMRENKPSFHELLNRTTIDENIKRQILEFENYKDTSLEKKGIYVHGEPGSGKTFFVERLLKEIDYDIIKYNASDVRNKNLIESLTSQHLANVNVLDMMKRKKRRLAIIMDEIDGMNGGDKGGITSLIKLIRQKKTKKQRSEHKSNIPIICIGNMSADKKTKELMKVCNVYEIRTPTNAQITKCLKMVLPEFKKFSKPMTEVALRYIQGDLRKMYFLADLYTKNKEVVDENAFVKIFQTKNHNDDVKNITRQLFCKPVPFDKYADIMNETERTTVSLLWHENVVDHFRKDYRHIGVYKKILNNICFADYIDRITFQYQIWQFNEMSYIIKLMTNNHIYHADPILRNCIVSPEMRFTKVLTKYSSEYSNHNFISGLCQKLGLDKKDVLCFFQEFRYSHPDMNTSENIYQLECLIDGYDISRLDIKRIYRYLDKSITVDPTLQDPQ